MSISSEIASELLDNYRNTNISLKKICARLNVNYSTAVLFIRDHFDKKFISDRNRRVFSIGMRTFSDEQAADLVKAYCETNGPLNKIAKRLGIGYGSAHKYLKQHLGEDFMRKHHFKVYSNNTSGIPNGRSREKHPRYNGGRYLQKFKTSHDPYWMVLKPDWYTGAKSTRYIPEHVIIACNAVGITELPKNFVVHHCDRNHFNNNFDNLVIMSKSDHSSLHKMLEKESVTTMEKSSTLKWLAEARGFILSDFLRMNDDIVFSEQECSAAN